MPPFIDQNQRAWPNDWRFWRSRLILSLQIPLLQKPVDKLAFLICFTKQMLFLPQTKHQFTKQMLFLPETNHQFKKQMLSLLQAKHQFKKQTTE